jgi:hypothetical protein
VVGGYPKPMHLKSDIEKLRAPASKKEAWQILRRINRLASSDNELALESIAKINVRDFVDPIGRMCGAREYRNIYYLRRFG